MVNKSSDKKIEDVFLTYANASLCKPENIFEIIGAIERSFKVSSCLNDVAKLVYEVQQCNDEKQIMHTIELCDAEEISKVDAREFLLGKRFLFDFSSKGKNLKINNQYQEEFLDYLHDTMDYGEWEELYFKSPRIKKLFEDGYPRKNVLSNCKYSEFKNYAYDIDCTKTYSLKCCECTQLSFIALLWQIAGGRPFLEIDDLQFAIASHKDISKQLEQNLIVVQEDHEGKACPQGTLHKINSPSLLFDQQKNQEYFKTLLHMIACYSLMEFLTTRTDNRDRIKICYECGGVYVQKRLREDQRFCCAKCRLKYNNRKRIESGEHAAYKKRRREQGATEGYY
jgi:hypothetical protein